MNSTAYPEDREGLRYCGVCKLWKKLEDFKKHSRTGRPTRDCKACAAERCRAWHEAHRDPSKPRRLTSSRPQEKDGKRLCSRCGAWLGVDEFVKHNSKGKPIRSSWCLGCAREYRRVKSLNYSRAKVQRKMGELGDEYPYFCRGCRTWKTLGDCKGSKLDKRGKPAMCTACTGLSAAERFKRSRKRLAARRAVDPELDLWHKYMCFASGHLKKAGFKKVAAFEQYLAVVKRAQGACEMCRRPFTAKGSSRMNIDHCHTTGALRGALCDNCNHMLGNAHDCVDLLQAGIGYLQRAPMIS